ncbi:hypothetical protein NIES2104_01290 [Leptolyngbya sp. NIES-2104]|nr:hypothetical protein NIES2104_01290 [Leptolyngbya sp. NIES-2104]
MRTAIVAIAIVSNPPPAIAAMMSLERSDFGVDITAEEWG